MRPDNSLSERSRTALERVRRAGVRVVLVTARGPRSVRVLAGAAGLDGIAICSNGAIALDLESGRVVRALPLGPEVAARLVRELDDDQLDRKGAFFEREISAGQVVERVLIGHPRQHLASIRAALGQPA